MDDESAKEHTVMVQMPPRFVFFERPRHKQEVNLQKAPEEAVSHWSWAGHGQGVKMVFENKREYSVTG